MKRTDNSLRTDELVHSLGGISRFTRFEFFNNSLVTTRNNAHIGRCGRLTCVNFIPILVRLNAVFSGVGEYGRSVIG